MILLAAACGIILALPFTGKADTSYTINNTTADAFLSGASPTLNFGGAGTLAIAPASSPKGEFDSVIMFKPQAQSASSTQLTAQAIGQSPV